MHSNKKLFSLNQYISVLEKWNYNIRGDNVRAF